MAQFISAVLEILCSILFLIDKDPSIYIATSLQAAVLEAGHLAIFGTSETVSHITVNSAAGWLLANPSTASPSSDSRLGNRMLCRKQSLLYCEKKHPILPSYPSRYSDTSS
jgi:hypothetical protein